MIENDFTISGTWEWRPEGSKEIAERFLDSLDALSAISPHFSSWKFTERNLEIEDLLAGEKPGQIGLEDVRNRFAEIVERGGQSDVAGNPLPQLGYQVSTWNGNEKSQIDPFSVTLRVQAGGDRTASRSVTFGTQYDQIPDPSIIAYPVFKATLLALADKWNVSGARAFSEELSQDWNYPALRFDLAWMTFLSAPLAAQIRPPSGIVSERTPGGGLLLVAAEERSTQEIRSTWKQPAASATHWRRLTTWNDTPSKRGYCWRMIESLKPRAFPGR